MVTECPLIKMAKEISRDNPQAHRASVTELANICDYYKIQPGLPVGHIEAHLAQLEDTYYADHPDGEPEQDGAYGDDDFYGPDFSGDGR